MIGVRLTVEEHGRILAKAEANGETMSDYARRLFDEETEPPALVRIEAKLDELIEQLL